MGWAYGQNADGRDIGYGVEATCDQDGCNAEIDRGLDYVCGSMHDGGEFGCGKYFCHEHMLSGHRVQAQGLLRPTQQATPGDWIYVQLCEACSAGVEEDEDEGALIDPADG
jgi:histidinol phosphatase-like PHP family hydrolase